MGELSNLIQRAEAVATELRRVEDKIFEHDVEAYTSVFEARADIISAVNALREVENALLVF